MIRAGKDSDADGIVALIGRCWADYPGCVLDLEHEERKLLALATYYADRGGALWIDDDTGSIAGMVAALPATDGAWEVAKLYVHPDRHGSGMARALLQSAEDHAFSAGAQRLVLWTDTRFVRAHRFYEKQSWVRDGPVRALDDLSKSIEFGYAKPRDGVVVLTPAAAASAVRRLSEILVATVDAGASVSFLPPLAPDVARAFMDGVAQSVAKGTCLLLAAWSGGVLSGTVQVHFAQQQNQPHRGDIAKMLVHPDARRHGLGAQLLQAAEAATAASGRTLLVLDTMAGSAGESLYRRHGWTEVGAIPGYSVDAAGQPEATVLFYKTV